MKERIRTTFTGKEKQEIIGAVLSRLATSANFTADEVKKQFFAVQDKVINATRKITEEKWPAVEKWLLPGIAPYVKLQGLSSKQHNDLVEDLQRRLREAISQNSEKQERIRVLELQVQNLNKQAWEVPKKEKPKKPTVVIAGLLHSQERFIKERHDNAFRLSFVTSDQYGNGQMSDRMRNADRVVLMTDFISHNSFQATLGDKAILVKGGMSSLHRVLSDLVI